MSVNSAKQRVEQLQEWMKTMNINSDKVAKKQGNKQPNFIDYGVKIKNGPSRR